MSFSYVPLAPLSRLERLLFPVLWRLTRQKARLKARWLSDEAARTIRINRQVLAKQLAPEALLYADLLQSCLTRLRQVHQPHADFDQASGQKKHKAQHVQFELIRPDVDILYYKVLTRRRTLRGPKNALPYGVYVTDLIRDETLLELSYACERVVTAKYDNPRKGVWLMVHRNEGISGVPTMVYFTQILSCFPADRSQGTLVLGVGEHRIVKSFDLESFPHVLVAGAAGSGKSNAVNVLICSMIRLYSPHEVRLMLVDLKSGMEFLFYRDTPHLMCEIIKEPSGALEALARLLEAVKERGDLLSANGCKKLATWNQAHPDQALPRLVLVIDEFAELVLASGTAVAKETLNLVKRIGALGRAVGVHLIIATQQPIVDVLPNIIKTNMAVTIAGRVQNTDQSRIIMSTGKAAKLPAIPGRVMLTMGADSWEIQIAYVSDETVQESVRLAQRAWPGPYANVLPTTEQIPPRLLARMALAATDGMAEAEELEQAPPQISDSWSEFLGQGHYLYTDNPDDIVAFSEIWNDFEGWCQARGQKPGSRKGLGVRLQKDRRTKLADTSVTKYRGIKKGVGQDDQGNQGAKGDQDDKGDPNRPTSLRAEFIDQSDQEEAAR